MRYLAWLPILSLAIGCDLAAKKEQSKTSETKKAKPAAPSGNSASEVELDPIPLKIKVKPGGMGAMDMSTDDKKSVTVDIGGGASLNIKPEERAFAAVKKSYAGDTVMFPFKKWEVEEDNRAILQFESDGKKGYIGLFLATVGGKNYLCKTTGLNGVASVDIAKKNLEPCKTLSAK